MIDAKGRERKGDWIQTFTGRQFFPLDPLVEDIHITDIAHATSRLCRYTGHTINFYSVAEHSCLVAELASDLMEAEKGGISPAIAMVALLHDASEAYLTDIPRPLKKLPEFAFYREAEERLTCAIHQAVHISPPPEHVNRLVGRADLMALEIERSCLLGDPPAPWSDLEFSKDELEILRDYMPAALGTESVAEAEHNFLGRYRHYRHCIEHAAKELAGKMGANKERVPNLQ